SLSSLGWYDRARATKRHKPRPHRFGWRRQNLLGIRLKLRQATGRAEEVFVAIVLRFVASGRGIHIHPADGVFCLRFGGGRCDVWEVLGVEVVHSLVCQSCCRLDPSTSLRAGLRGACPHASSSRLAESSPY